MKTVMFVGDSITDAGRKRDDLNSYGQGYPVMVAGRLGLDNPGAYRFINQGVSGDRVVDIFARLKKDVLNLKPDMMSILVGVNDVWHELDFSNGVSAKKFEKVYSMMLDEILEELPGVKIMLMEPFVLKGTATEEHLDWFKEEVTARAEVVRKLAKQYNLPFMPLQEDLDELVTKMPENYWLWDGVHPTANFHQYIADKWIQYFDKL